ncbi:Retrovirus-related Pol polyprotein from type-1 retrotransposable element R1 (Fragment), partial [Anthophora retusa]
MMASSGSKFSGGKLAPHSDLRAGAGPGDAILAVRSPRPWTGRGATKTAKAVSSVSEQRRPVTRSMATARLGSTHRRDAPGRPSSASSTEVRAHQCSGLRTVRIHLERCDALPRPRPAAPAVQTKPCCVRVIKTVKINININTGTSSANRSASNSPARCETSLPRETAKPRAQPPHPPRTTANHRAIATTGIRLLQLNAQRSVVVSGEIRQLVTEKRLDVLILQEPYARRQGTSYVVSGLGTGVRVAAAGPHYPWAAVAVCNPNFDILSISQLSTAHCACVEVLAPGFSFYVVSCYFQYSDEIERHLSHLETVLRFLRGKRIILGIDANARSSLWGPQGTDERGAQFEALIRSFGLGVVNDAAQSPTFTSTAGSSYIDVTLASPSILPFFRRWKVRCDWASSDHNAVEIRLMAPKAVGSEQSAEKPRFNTRRADWDLYSAKLSDLSRSRLEGIELDSPEKVESLASQLTGAIVDACSEAMPRKRKFRKSNPWWTEELTSLKKEAYRNRREFQRERDDTSRARKKLVYRASLRKYRQRVRKVKTQSWRDFVTSHGNAEPWGIVYKLQAQKFRAERVISTLRRSSNSATASIDATASLLLDTHVPDDRAEDDTANQRIIREQARFAPSTEDTAPFSGAEVISAARTFANRKAPGPDQIEVLAMKAACTAIPDQMVRLFNGCLQWGVFPSIWKESSLRALLKGEDKDEMDPKSYRPICVLSVLGKLFEKLLKKRLDQTSLAPGKVSDRQFGFTAGKSTEDAILEMRRIADSSEGRHAIALLFDISGAFDNVWWPLVLEALKARDCPRNIFEVMSNYFSNRRVLLSLGNTQRSKQATRGCPQGSVLGPACWNLMFDDLLRKLKSSVGDKFVAYADDLIVVVSADNRRQLEVEGQNVSDIISSWCKEAKLEISARKSEAIILRSGWIKREPIGRRGGARPDRKRKALRSSKTDLSKRPPTIRIGSTNFKFSSAVRYLGVHFDSGMGVHTHCRYVSDKVGSLVGKLGRLARCQWGLRFNALSAIYTGFALPFATYAAAAWADLCTERDIGVLRSMQRRALLAVTSAYRRTSWEGLCVVAGALPIDIQLEKHRALFNLRRGRDASIEELAVPTSTQNAAGCVRDEAVSVWQTRGNEERREKKEEEAKTKKKKKKSLDQNLPPTHPNIPSPSGRGRISDALTGLGLTLNLTDTIFDTRRADWKRYAASLADLSPSRLEDLRLESAEDVEEMASRLTDVITDACTASMPRKRRFRKSNPWWTSELTKLKKVAYWLRSRLKETRTLAFKRSWNTPPLCGNTAGR